LLTFLKQEIKYHLVEIFKVGNLWIEGDAMIIIQALQTSLMKVWVIHFWMIVLSPVSRGSVKITHFRKRGGKKLRSRLDREYRQRFQ